eukprot:scaffold130484_cov19-Tisochrysis_lutea.AAC.2
MARLTQQYHVQKKEGTMIKPPHVTHTHLNDINGISEGIEGACTSTPNFHVSNLLQAGDLCLTSWESLNNLQTMLHCLKAYTRRKFLTIPGYDV